VKIALNVLRQKTPQLEKSTARNRLGRITNMSVSDKKVVTEGEVTGSNVALERPPLAYLRTGFLLDRH
jgi:hypothetical protein